MKAMGLWHDESSPDAKYSDVLELNLADVEPSLAGPKRPQDRIALKDSKEAFHQLLVEHQLRRDNTIASTTERYFACEGGVAVGTVSTAELGAGREKEHGEETFLRHAAGGSAGVTSCPH